MYKDECDKRLVELTLCGDSGAFEQLVVRHKRAVLGTAYKITRNHYSAEDAAQDAFVAAWLQLKSLTVQDKFGSYVCAIAKNYAKKTVMRDSRFGPMFSLTEYENQEFDFDDQGGGLEDIFEDVIFEQLHAEVELLSETVRETIKLHYFTGLSVKEISARLGVPEGTVKWRLSEGRKKLQKGFGVVNKKNKAADDNMLVARVMKQIQELELCQMKNNRQGLQEAYQLALEAVEGLQDERKNYLLASVLNIGVQLERSEERMSRWKQAILDGHNDMMMCHFTSWENYHLDGQEQIRHLDSLLSLKNLRATQWTPVAGQPFTSDFIPVLQRIQNAGKNLVLVPKPWEVEKLLDNLSSRGLHLMLGEYPSQEAALEMIDLIEKHSKDRG